MSKISDSDVYVILDNYGVDLIAKALARMERRKLGTTLLSAFVAPRLYAISRWLNRRG